MKKGDKFSINKTCPYVLATDFCEDNTEFNYLIYVDHEHRNENKKAIYIKSITILFNRKIYEIAKNFKVF